MTGAMYAAVSGLKTHMSAMNVIGNNISNVNTLGYKATRYTFNEALYTTYRNGSNGSEEVGGRNPAQVGYGCSIGTIDLDMSSKNYNPTGMAMDCMIDGDGFFLVGDKTNKGVTTQAQLQGLTLTRLGNFEIKDGYLVDGNGMVVYGFLRVGESGYDAAADTGTEEVELNDIPILTPIRVPYSTLQTTETGTVRTVIAWPELSENGNEVVDNQAAEGALYGEDGFYNSDDSEDLLAPYKRITHDNISIDEKTGRISLITSDEQLVVIGYLAIGKVDSPNGVSHVDGRYYQALDGAGDIHLTSIGGAIQYAGGEDTTGDVDFTTNVAVESAGGVQLITGGLESSGTDLANEISNMIVIQRGYQANTRIVTVTDSMLEELVNMKR